MIFGAQDMTPDELIAWRGDYMSMALEELDKLMYTALRWRLDPVLYAIEKYRMTPLPYQVLALLLLADSPREVFEFYREIIGEDAFYENKKRQLLLPSGHGLGKTRFLALAATWHRDTHQFSKTLITAPTMNQISGQLFGEVSKLRRRAMSNDLGCIFEDDWEVQTSSVVHRNEANKDWKIYSATARVDSPESMQGAHALDDDDEFGEIAALFGDDIVTAPSGGMMIIAEEASGIPDQIRQVLQGALSETGARFVAAGNPTRADGWFADDCKKTDLYAVTPLDCRMSNNEEIYHIPYRDFGGKISQLPIRGRVSPKYWEDMLAECDGDEDADYFRVRVRGMTPRSNATQCLTSKWIDAATQRDAKKYPKSHPLVVSLDFGLTSDKHALAVRHGKSFLTVEAWLPKERPEDVTMEAARRGIDAVKTFRNRANKVLVIGDANGVGRGAVEVLHAKFSDDEDVQVIFFNAGKAAIDKKRYHRHRDQMWHKSGRSFFSDPDASIPQAPGLSKQLSTPEYSEDDGRKIRVESKKLIKKRTGEPSGNEADAVLMNIYADEFSEFSTGKTEKPQQLNDVSDPLSEHFKKLRNRSDSGYFIGAR